MNKTLASVKVAINNDMNAAVSFQRGKGHVTALKEMIADAGFASFYINCTVDDVTDLALPRVKDGVVFNHINPSILGAEVIIIEELDKRLPGFTSIDELINNRTIFGQTLPYLKSVIVLHDSFASMLEATEGGEFLQATVLVSFA